MNRGLIYFGKTFSGTLKKLNLGNGSTWPGHIALKANKQFIRQVLAKSKTKIIVVAGTNGKTTTSSLIKTVLKKNGKTVLHNESGANLLNGIASTIVLNTDTSGKLSQEYAIFEIDENVLPLLLKEIHPDYLVLMNLFRDQLDRYGEINAITTKWQQAIASLTDKTTLILNADDPQIAFLGNGMKKNVHYFGVKTSEKTHSVEQTAADAVYCPKCGKSLDFKEKTFSHLGNWKCAACSLAKPKNDLDHLQFYPLAGQYNEYNTHAAALVLKHIGLSESEITYGMQDFKPAFGRQEIIMFENKKVQLFLSKNPTSFNQSFSTIKNLKAKTLLLVLNDRIPDGHDISWIWDIDLTGIEDFKKILISGDRAYDMALRIQYADYKRFETFRNVELAIRTGIAMTKEDETFYILPNYSAMLEVRKILTGKKIL